MVLFPSIISIIIISRLPSSGWRSGCAVVRNRDTHRVGGWYFLHLRFLNVVTQRSHELNDDGCVMCGRTKSTWPNDWFSIKWENKQINCPILRKWSRGTNLLFGGIVDGESVSPLEFLLLLMQRNSCVVPDLNILMDIPEVGQSFPSL